MAKAVLSSHPLSSEQSIDSIRPFLLFGFLHWQFFIAKTQSDRKFKLIVTNSKRNFLLFTFNCFLIDTNNYVDAALYQLVSKDQSQLILKLTHHCQIEIVLI